MTNDQLIIFAEKKVSTLTSAITQSAFTSIHEGLECELELANFALSALQEHQKAPAVRVMHMGVELITKEGLELIRDGISEATDLEITAMAEALLSVQPLNVRECETCAGTGKIDERLGGYSFSNPEAKCPDCDGSGEYYPAPQILQQIPAGFTLVPTMPTQEMAVAGGDTYVRCEDVNQYPPDAARRIWAAMTEAQAKNQVGQNLPCIPSHLIPEEATLSNINLICPAGLNQTEFASGWNDCRENRINHGQLPPIIKGIDSRARGWNACRAAMLLGATPCTK